MKKDLKNKIALIIAVLLICLYGIFGVPSGISGKALLAAISNRIHLGLDLQGGAHLILQVFEAGSLLRRLAADCGRTPWQLFGSLKNVARRLLESLRYHVLNPDAFDVALAGRVQCRFEQFDSS